jgi:hypothetical protein
MNKRITPPVLEADRVSFAALQGIAGYSPANPAYTLAKVGAARDALQGAQATEAQAAAALATARDNAVAAEWEFHNLILGAKDQVIAQFGRDSNEVQALGLKKASERKAPTRRKAPAEVKA